MNMAKLKSEIPEMTAGVSPGEIFRGHIPELDGLRAVGMAIVLLNHTWSQDMSILIWHLKLKAWIAMDSFFVLSGFLIAGILLDTRSNPDYYRSYYIRRSLRIFPLYYCVISFLTLVAVFWHGGTPYRLLVAEWGSPAWFFVYLGNFRAATAGCWPTVPGFIPLWSLQIEEQFYLVFPFIVRHLRLETLWRALWVMVFLSLVARVGLFLWNPHNPYLQLVLLPCHMEGLALGVLIAIRFRRGPWQVAKGRLTALTVVLLAATVIGSAWSNASKSPEEWATPFNRTVGYSLSSVACACLLLWLIHFRGSKWTRLLRIRPVQFLGKISYGIYLFHMPVWTAGYAVCHALGWSLLYESFPGVAAVTALSILCASASWYLLERPLLRLKDRWASIPLLIAKSPILARASRP